RTLVPAGDRRAAVGAVRGVGTALPAQRSGTSGGPVVVACPFVRGRSDDGLHLLRRVHRDFPGADSVFPTGTGLLGAGCRGSDTTVLVGLRSEFRARWASGPPVRACHDRVWAVGRGARPGSDRRTDPIPEQ